MRGIRDPWLEEDGDELEDGPAPGKTTLTQRLRASRGSAPPRHDAPDGEAAAPPVQRTALPDPFDFSFATPAARIAGEGVAGASGSLPHLDRLGEAFGPHDVSGVRVASGGAAADAARRLGASAYAFGDTIASAGPLDLRTAAHEATHVVQQRAGIDVPGGLSMPGDASEREADAVADAVVGGASAVPLLDAIAARGGGGARAVVQRDVSGTSALHPEACPTFEMWMAQFRDLPTFLDSDGEDDSGTVPDRRGRFRVFGDRAAERHGGERGVDPSPTAPHDTVGRAAGDRFIDHPTDTWVRANLPDELRITAYQLPTDCADIAAILRHVWLQAHGRTERYSLRVRGGRRTITLGAGLGTTPAARRDGIRGEIAGGRGSRGLSSASAAAMVQTYRDESGQPIFDWNAVSRRLHPGDIVVWEHRDRATDRAYGGHVQTVQSVERGSDGRVSMVRFVAGNQPLNLDDAEEIRRNNPDEVDRAGMSEGALRDAPGRRLEMQSANWTGNVGEGSAANRWGGLHEGRHRGDRAYTCVIAVGPPAAAEPPRAAGAPVRLADWTPRVTAAADAGALQAIFESALAEVRAAIEGGGTAPEAELTAFGQAVAARAAAIDPAGTLRATLLEVAESMASARGSTEDAALHGGPDSEHPGRGANARNPRLDHVRTAFAFVRAALTPAVAATAAPSARLADLPLRFDAAADQAAIDALWTTALDAVVADTAATEATAEAVGRHAGERIWALTRTRARTVAGDRGTDHFSAIYSLRALVNARATATPAAAARLAALDRGLDGGARGMTTIDWSRVASDGLDPGAVIRHVLVTGFDPYTGGPRPPTASDWNPSGAAVMRLDGEQLRVGAELVAIEGVVYPVSFAQFDTGIVERVVSGEAPSADAVITVSMDPNLSATGGDTPMIEQYTVGVRHASTLMPHPATGSEPMADEIVRIPASGRRRTSAGAAAYGPAVIDAGARDGGPRTDLAGIAGAAGIGVRGGILLAFTDADAGRARTALAGRAFETLDSRHPPHTYELTDRALERTIAADAAGDFGDAASRSPAVTFTIGSESFTATLVGGPGGNFLSNEVGYRTERTLSETGSSADSFHIHTADETTNIDTLVGQLRAVVRATIERRQAAGRASASSDRAS